MTDLVKEKIIELVPDIASKGSMCIAKSPHPKKCKYGIYYRKITLADVLRAIGKTKQADTLELSISYTGSDTLFMEFEDESVWYDLTTDYDGQTQEVRDFIGKLLNV